MAKIKVGPAEYKKIWDAGFCAGAKVYKDSFNNNVRKNEIKRLRKLHD